MSVCFGVAAAVPVVVAAATPPARSLKKSAGAIKSGFNASKAFGLTAARSRLTMATFKITLKTPEGVQEFESSDEEIILDAAEQNGLDLPYSCRAGACSSCAGFIESGKVDQHEQSFLDEDQLEQGFVLTCMAYPLSDVVIKTHMEEDING